MEEGRSWDLEKQIGMTHGCTSELAGEQGVLSSALSPQTPQPVGFNANSVSGHCRKPFPAPTAKAGLCCQGPYPYPEVMAFFSKVERPCMLCACAAPGALGTLSICSWMHWNGLAP